MMRMNKAAKWIALVAAIAVLASGVITMGAVASQQQVPPAVSETPAE